MRRRALLRIALVSPGFFALERLSARSVWAGTPPTIEAGAQRLLDDETADLLLAIVERMVETGELDAPAPRAIGTLAAIEGVLAHLDPAVVDELRLALRLVDWWPALLEGRFSRFRSLGSEEKDESLRGWERSRLATRRRVFYALRNLALLGYWSQPETWPLIGYGGPWIRRGA